MLRQFRGKFLFKSELLLEEFVWLNLNKLLKISPLKRQYIVDSKNRTDILGITQERRLAIIELKKKGGKASIEQLVRYRDNILKYSSQSSVLSYIDFKQDFVLIAIAGYFSKQTKEYATKKLPQAILLTYEINKSHNSEYSLILKKNNKIYFSIKIDVVEDSLFDSLPSFIQGYLIDNSQHRAPILFLIKRILSFDSSIGFETYNDYSSHGYIKKDLLFAKYNKKGEIINNKICAEFSYYYDSNSNARLVLSVYLPTVDLNVRGIKRRKLIDGITIYTDDFVKVNKLVDINTVISQGSGISPRYPLKTADIDETYSSFEDYYINYRRYMKSRKTLRPINHSDFTLVENIIDITLEDLSVR